MIIKVAIKKEDKKVVWRDPYSAAIRNRLRIDLNLSDVQNKEEALTNIGVRSYTSKRIGDIPWSDETNETTVKEYIDVNDKRLADKEEEDIRKLREEMNDLRESLLKALNDAINDLNNKIRNLRDYVDESLRGMRTELTTSINSIEKLPIGSIIPFFGNIGSIPANWSICDGSNGTPDLRDRFIQGWGKRGAGSAVEAGLPNITGSFGAQDNYDWGGRGGWSGALYKGEGAGSPDGRGGGETDSWSYYGFDASRSNPIYGSSDTVQPKSYVAYYIMKMREK